MTNIPRIEKRAVFEMKYWASQQAKILGIFLIVGIFCSSLMVFRVQSAQQDADVISSAGTISDGRYSYLIFQNATATYMVDGVTDVIDFGSTNASAVINDAQGNTTANGEIYVYKGTYQISSVTVSNAVHFLGEDGCVWNLTAKPCLTVNAPAIFEGINFSTVVDGYTHIALNNDTTFEKCTFNCLIDSTAYEGVIDETASSPISLTMEDCSLVGGRQGADDFYFVTLGEAVNTNFTTLAVNDFTVENLVVSRSGGTDNRTQVFTVDHACGDSIVFGNIMLKNVTASVAMVLNDYNYTRSLVVDAFTFLGPMTYESGGNGVASNAHMNPIGGSNYGTATLTNFNIFDRSHEVIIARHLSIDGWIQSPTNTSETYSGGIDLGATNFYPCDAEINNFQGTNNMIDMDGYTHLTLTNCIFSNARLLILDETSNTYPKVCEATNCMWLYNSSLPITYGSDIEIVGVTTNLTQLTLSNCYYERNLFGFDSNFSCGPCQIILNGITSDWTYHSYNYPCLVSATDYRDSNVTFSISNSRIATVYAPLGYIDASIPWPRIYTYSSNDRFENVQWKNWTDINTGQDYVSLSSEYTSSATNSTDTTFTFTDTLVASPAFVSCSFNVTGYTDYSWTRSGNTITVTVSAKPNSAAFTCYLYAKVTP